MTNYDPHEHASRAYRERREQSKREQDLETLAGEEVLALIAQRQKERKGYAFKRALTNILFFVGGALFGQIVFQLVIQYALSR